MSQSWRGYTLPVFDLTVQLYTAGAGPPAAPRVLTQGNLTPGKRAHQAQLVAAAQVTGLPAMFLLLPKLTDVRGQNTAGGSDLAQVPANSGRIYTVLWADDVGKGFANEHRFAVLIQRAPFALDVGQPFPPMMGGGGVGGGIVEIAQAVAGGGTGGGIVTFGSSLAGGGTGGGTITWDTTVRGGGTGGGTITWDTTVRGGGTGGGTITWDTTVRGGGTGGGTTDPVL